MQAITVKFIGPTNHRGARLKATAAAGTITVGYPYGVSNATRFAADALCEKLGGPRAGWDSSRLIDGTLPDGSSVFVMGR